MFAGAIDIELIRAHLSLVVKHYEKSAPTVASWANDLYVRLNENVYDVRVVEVMQAQLLLEDKEWEHPHYAANKVYKLMSELGQNTAGHAGF